MKSSITKYTIQWCQVSSHCCAIITTTHLQNSFHLATEAPYSSSNRSPWLPPLLITFLWFAFFFFYFWRFHMSEIRLYLCFWVWLILLSMMSSNFIHIVTNVRASFLLMLNNTLSHICAAFFFLFFFPHFSYPSVHRYFFPHCEWSLTNCFTFFFSY